MNVQNTSTGQVQQVLQYVQNMFLTFLVSDAPQGVGPPSDCPKIKWPHIQVNSLRRAIDPTLMERPEAWKKYPSINCYRQQDIKPTHGALCIGCSDEGEAADATGLSLQACMSLC